MYKWREEANQHFPVDKHRSIKELAAGGERPLFVEKMRDGEVFVRYRFLRR